MKRSRAVSGFTLVEIMIVVAIMGIMLAIGLPSAMRLFQRDPLRQTEANILEACSHARARAILNNHPVDLVISGEGDISVQSVSVPRLRGDAAAFESRVEDSPGLTGAAPAAFSRRMHEDVAVELFYVNLTDQMQAVESRVRFHPNGMSDEMTIVLNWMLEERRMITLDPITGLADIEVFR